MYDGTPTAAVGLEAGDTITVVGTTGTGTRRCARSHRVTGTTALRRAIAAHSPGDRVSLTWSDTAGRSHTATVRLTEGAVE
ncbi:MAG: hypothetical protein WB441_15665 [Nocardioidaceae bacterium]